MCMGASHPAYDVHAVDAQQTQMSEQNEYFRTFLCFFLWLFYDTSLGILFQK